MVYVSTRRERRQDLRNCAIQQQGLSCQACGFNFGDAYGEWGVGYAEVHHIAPVAEMPDEGAMLDAEEELVVLCANCHRMVHRKRGQVLSLDELTRTIHDFQHDRRIRSLLEAVS